VIESRRNPRDKNGPADFAFAPAPAANEPSLSGQSENGGHPNGEPPLSVEIKKVLMASKDRQWKPKRPELQSILVRAAAVVNQFEQMEQNRPAELEKLIELSSWDEACRLVKRVGEPHSRRRSAKQRFDRRRHARRMGRQGLIEREFGTESATPMANNNPLTAILPRRTCLDELLEGGRVKMSRDWNCLENLFEKERHVLSKILRQKKINGTRVGREITYDYKAFIAIASQLFADRVWLADPKLWQRVSAAVALRVSEVTAKAPVKKAFNGFFDSGK
jgi:hypothetical protein